MDFKEFAQEWISDSDYITVHTSGSTGVPKEIRLSKEAVRMSALRTIDFFGIGEEAGLHSCLSADTIAGKMMYVRAYEAGALFSAEEPSNEPLAMFRGSDYLDMVCVVPSQLRYILRNKRKMPRIGVILVGGAPLSDALRMDVGLSKFNVYETYGMTETASHIALRHIHRGVPQTFRTLPGITVATDERGCLTADVPGLGHVVTNDIVRVFSSTSFKIKGRYDNVIITGGKKVHPEEMEGEMNGLLGGRECMFVGEPDEKWGQRVVMLVEGLEPLQEYLEKSILAYPVRYKAPKEIRYVEKLPRTRSGKLRRR